MAVVEKLRQAEILHKSFNLSILSVQQKLTIGLEKKHFQIEELDVNVFNN